MALARCLRLLQRPNISDKLGTCVPWIGPPVSVGAGGLGEHKKSRSSDTGRLRTVVDSRRSNSEVFGRCFFAVKGQHAGVCVGDFFAEPGNVEVRGAESVVGPAVAFGKIGQADAELQEPLEFVRGESTGRQPGLGQYRPEPVPGIRVI